jgi:hypothetical protein
VSAAAYYVTAMVGFFIFSGVVVGTEIAIGIRRRAPVGPADGIEPRSDRP